jgi:Lrp/AsnC family transcriptional regulator, leucine-responsive regulatory protein
MEKELDDVNLKILDILQRDARTPVKQIAAEVCLSSPAVSARIERMEEENLISGYQVKLNYHQFGYFIKAFINLEVEPKQKPEFYPFIKSVPNVIECNCVTGDYAMLIEVAFRKTEELDRFINDLQHFGKTHTQIIFSTSVEHRNVPVLLRHGSIEKTEKPAEKEN